jgi:NADP-dependent aldehyde dehydrogenase
MSYQSRAHLLRAIGDRLNVHGDKIVEIASRETSLDRVRIQGELIRTVSQITIYADALERRFANDQSINASEGSVGRASIFRTFSGIGPVANFEASNFPLAFGALGTDTVSALAAGCPVIVKIHPAHPGTSELCVRIANEVFIDESLEGAVTFVHGDAQVSADLVQADQIAAVTFTGSQSVGRILLDLAARRAKPIPVFAEMGSLNPIIITQGMFSNRDSPELASTIASSVCSSAGQLCTKPGLIFVPHGRDGDRFSTDLQKAIGATGPFSFIDDRIKSRFISRMAEVEAIGNVKVLLGSDPDRAWLYEVVLNSQETADFQAVFCQEMFGPATVIVRYGDFGQVSQVLNRIGGQLVISFYALNGEISAISTLIKVAMRNAGRIVWCGVPTGVAVVEGMHHGGPWPASSASIGSVGPEAITRFLRPVTWQGFPNEALPQVFRLQS